MVTFGAVVPSVTSDSVSNPMIPPP
jgi:hypothetical protein